MKYVVNVYFDGPEKEPKIYNFYDKKMADDIIEHATKNGLVTKLFKYNKNNERVKTYFCDDCHKEFELTDDEYDGMCPACHEHHGFYTLEDDDVEELQEALNEEHSNFTKVMNKLESDLDTIYPLDYGRMKTESGFLSNGLWYIFRSKEIPDNNWTQVYDDYKKVVDAFWDKYGTPYAVYTNMSHISNDLGVSIYVKIEVRDSVIDKINANTEDILTESKTYGDGNTLLDDSELANCKTDEKIVFTNNGIADLTQKGLNNIIYTWIGFEHDSHGGYWRKGSGYWYNKIYETALNVKEQYFMAQLGYPEDEIHIDNFFSSSDMIRIWVLEDVEEFQESLDTVTPMKKLKQNKK